MLAHLHDVWAQTPAEPGDPVHLLAKARCVADSMPTAVTQLLVPFERDFLMH